MGTTTSTLIVKGKTMAEAFRNASQDAEEEHGHGQGYSGHINVTRLTRDVTSQYKSSSNKAKYIDDLLENLDSGECYGVELEKSKVNTNKIKTTVEIISQKGTKKWETRYVAELFGEQTIALEKTQGAAIKKARAYVEKHQCMCRIYLTKVLVKGNSHVASIRYKQSKMETDGKYLFIYAAKD